MKILEYRVTEEPDIDTAPSDFDCYSVRRLNAWNRDEWRYIGIIVTEVREDEDGFVYHGETTSLWGIESDSPSEYIADVISELTRELKGEI